MRRAAARSQIRAGGTRAFHGRRVDGETLDVSAHRGVVAWEPAELVLTARAGTPLAGIEALLASGGQMLAFEPPRFGPASTLGGAIATAMSGPRRPYAGAARDFVLGVRCVNGRGELLGFGGQVMKNVAGYDVSRLMCGACGTLGVLLEISLKVLPVPPCEITVEHACDAAQAIVTMNRTAGRPLPLSASSHDGERLRLRLSGAESAVSAAAAALGGDVVDDAAAYWNAVRDQSLAFFRAPGALWRLSVPPATPPLALGGEQFIEWGGALRWLRTARDAGRGARRRERRGRARDAVSRRRCGVRRGLSSARARPGGAAPAPQACLRPRGNPQPGPHVPLAVTRR